MKSLLTIVTVTANRPKEFRKALQSIVRLQFKDYTVIIGDDSKDGASKEIAKKIIPHAKYFLNSPPLGEILNTNKYIGLAQSEYVCLFHDDDSFEPKYFNQIIEVMKENHDIDLAYTGRIMVDQNDKELARQVIESDNNMYIYNAEDILDFMVFGKQLSNYKVFINTPGLVFRKKIFDAVGGIDPNIDTHCDTDFLLKILLTSRKVLFINKPLFNNKIWYGLSGRTKSSENGNVFFAEKGVLDNFLKFSKKKGRSKYYKNEEKIFNKFTIDSISVNGPLSWISLRFKGNYIDKVEAMITTSKAIVRLNKKVLLYPKFYFVFIINLILPKFIRNVLHKLILKYYLTKK